MSAHQQTEGLRPYNDETHLWQAASRQLFDPNGPDIDAFVAWLAKTLNGAHVALFAPSGAVEAASSDDARRHLAPAARDARLVAAAVRPKGASIDEGAMPLRMVLTRPAPPGDVLAVALPGAWSSSTTRLFHRAAVTVGVLKEKSSLASQFRRQQQTARQQADTVFRLLMQDPSRAQSSGVHVAPDVLAADRVRVCVIDCHTEQAAPRTLDAVEEALGAHVLAVVCASIPQHINIVIPADETEASTRAALGEIVVRRPGHRMGVSSAIPEDAVPAGYRAAKDALPLASEQPDRVAQIDVRQSVVSVLDRRLLRQWADWRLRPLLELPKSERTRLWATLQAFIEFPQRRGAAGCLGIHRNTVRDHISKMCHLLGLDLDDPLARTELYLALACDDQHGLERASIPPGLEVLYDSDAARIWATARLAQLTDEQRTTLTVWLDHGGDTRRAAAQLRIGEPALRTRINRASQALQVDLRACTSGTYEVITALRINKATVPRSAPAAGRTRPPGPAPAPSS